MSRYLTSELIKDLTPLSDIAGTCEDLSKVILFGSFAKQKQKASSDIDIALVLERKVLFYGRGRFLLVYKGI